MMQLGKIYRVGKYVRVPLFKSIEDIGKEKRIGTITTDKVFMPVKIKRDGVNRVYVKALCEETLGWFVISTQRIEYYNECFGEQHFLEVYSAEED